MTETVEVTNAAAADEETAKVEETATETTVETTKVEETAAETAKTPVATPAKSPSVAPSVKAASDLLYGALDPLAL